MKKLLLKIFMRFIGINAFQISIVRIRAILCLQIKDRWPPVKMSDLDIQIDCGRLSNDNKDDRSIGIVSIQKDPIETIFYVFDKKGKILF